MGFSLQHGYKISNGHVHCFHLLAQWWPAQSHANSWEAKTDRSESHSEKTGCSLPIRFCGCYLCERLSSSAELPFLQPCNLPANTSSWPGTTSVPGLLRLWSKWMLDCPQIVAGVEWKGCFFSFHHTKPYSLGVLVGWLIDPHCCTRCPDPVPRASPLAGRRKRLEVPCFKLLGFCLRSRGWGRSQTSWRFTFFIT